jgi:cation:H+ antiporter
VSTTVAALTFGFGTLASLATSWVLVSRIERIGGRFGASEAMLGLMAALAADTPEISSAVSALAHHQRAVGVGVVLGSNVFNLAALLGLGAVVARRIALHRRVVVLEGVVAVWVAVMSLLTVQGVFPPAAGLALVLAVLLPYAVLAGSQRGRSGTGRLRRSINAAIREEELELRPAMDHRRGRSVDVAVASLALVIVVTASVAMERAASTLGSRFSISDIVVGTVVLAGVTSLPNAVAAVYLARLGRGAATLSTALNSNALNVAAGLLVPALIIGIGRPISSVSAVAGWYLALTVGVLVLAYRDSGLRRSMGVAVIAAYGVFVGVIVSTA